ncbi:MAG: AraC family transcriptional regulator [Clostridiales bacterium]|nr:AraC family transcriptional regulator [Clostridiales bacterium]
MDHFGRIADALRYIDDHLDEPLRLEAVAARVHLSPHYFHRLFSAVVGQGPALYARSRRLQRACAQLADTDRPIQDIALDGGYDSAQSFYRAFKAAYGTSPGRYRSAGASPTPLTAEALIQRFANRLKGGVFVHPRIIRRGALRIAGASGDGSKTGEVWQAFMALSEATPLLDRHAGDGYEVRVYDGERCDVHVGSAIEGRAAPAPYALLALPASHYAAFDVYVANGYDSENGAMDDWLRDNAATWRQRLLDGRPYVVEFYDERFHGEEAGSLVEIWVPIAAQSASQPENASPDSGAAFAADQASAGTRPRGGLEGSGDPSMFNRAGAAAPASSCPRPVPPFPENLCKVFSR